MTKRERRKNALQLLAIRWALVTIIALLTLSGIYHFDRFQITKVIKPLIELYWLNDDIKCNVEMEANLQGQQDNTEYSQRIIELSVERRDKYYNNEDAVIAYVCKSFSLVKIFYFLCAIALIVVLTILPLIILFGIYWNVYRRFKKTWARIKEHSKKMNGSGPKVERFSDYCQFDDSIKSI